MEMSEDKKIDEINEKLDKTEDYEIIINLLYQKVDLLEEIIGKLKNQNKLASKEHEERFNECEAELEKKDKIIDLMAQTMAQAGVGRRSFACDFGKECIQEGCRACIKQYFERKVEE